MYLKNNVRAKSMLHTNASSFICLGIFMIIALVEYLYLPQITYLDHSMKIISIIIVMNLVLMLLISIIVRIPLVSFFTMFIAFYYLVHFGQVIMLGLFPYYDYDYINYILVYMKDWSVLCDTIGLCINVINCFFCGGLICNLITQPVLPKSNNNKLNNSKRTAKIIFLLFLPFRLLIDLSNLVAAFSGGYGATLNNSLPGVFSAFASMWYLVLPLLYIELKDKRIKRLFLVMTSIYCVITMFAGQRGHVVVSLISLMVVVLSEIGKIPLRKVIKYIVLGLIGLFILDLVFDIRQNSISAFFDNEIDFISGVLSNNIIFETIGTFGETLFTPYLVVRGYDSLFKPFFGECFIKSIASLVPDLFGWFKQINNEAIFSKMLETSHTIGGSFAGEMLYNFGSLYPILSIVFGFIICKCSRNVSIFTRTHEMDKLVSSIVFCSLSLWWVRDSFGNMLRPYVWFLVLYFILSQLGNNKRRLLSL